MYVCNPFAALNSFHVYIRTGQPNTTNETPTHTNSQPPLEHNPVPTFSLNPGYNIQTR
jgi:hypothetical protein